MSFKVVEIFESINGEGMRAGELAVFVRMKGCNLSCNYCDTMWANEADCEFEEMTADRIVERVKKSGIKMLRLPVVNRFCKRMQINFLNYSQMRRI